MATQAQTITTAAIANSLANDGGRSELASDLTELLGVLNRRIRLVYTIAGMPRDLGGAGRGDYFATSATVTLASTPVALPAAAFKHIFERQADGHRVDVIARQDLLDNIAELPPCVLVEQNAVIGAGRAGDPAAGDVLTVRYTPLPDLLRAGTDYIGATTRTDPTTTVWPGHVGDPYLVAWLAMYLARKSGDRDAAELQSLQQEFVEASKVLGVFVGADGIRLAGDEVPTA